MYDIEPTTPGCCTPRMPLSSRRSYASATPTDGAHAKRWRASFSALYVVHVSCVWKPLELCGACVASSKLTATASPSCAGNCQCSLTLEPPVGYE